MLIQAEQIRTKFARALREALIAHYGKLPAASHLSREFNLRAYGVNSISQESARRWLRGLSIPTQDKLAILSNWLSLDLNNIVSVQEQGSAQKAPAPVSLANLSNGTANGHDSNIKQIEPPLAAVQMLSQLSELERNLMMELLGLLANRAPSEPQSPDIGGGGVTRTGNRSPPEGEETPKHSDPAPGRAAGLPHPPGPPPGG